MKLFALPLGTELRNAVMASTSGELSCVTCPRKQDDVGYNYCLIPQDLDVDGLSLVGPKGHVLQKKYLHLVGFARPPRACPIRNTDSYRAVFRGSRRPTRVRRMGCPCGFVSRYFTEEEVEAWLETARAHLADNYPEYQIAYPE